MAVTQRERVLAALRKAGARGVTQVDFLLPDVVDGGPPVTRVGARVHELVDTGYRIVAAGRRDKCRVYRLDRDLHHDVDHDLHHDVDRDLHHGEEVEPGALFGGAVGVGRPRSPYEDVVE